MAKHRFKVGDDVRLSGTFERPASSSNFKVVRLVPGDREDLPPAYRVKSVTEGHERMVKEDEIRQA
jgi:hypothetical protein